MIIGFTGTRKGLSPTQAFVLCDSIKGTLILHDAEDEKVTLLHGGAEGADEGMDIFHNQDHSIEVYSCTNTRYLYWCERGDGVVRAVHTPRPPLVRNKIIVDRCAHLIAAPAGMDEELRSGTWATIRYARKQHKPITIVFPDGTVREE